MKFIRKVSQQIIIIFTLLSVCACSTTRLNIVQPGDSVSIVLANNSSNEKLLDIKNSSTITDNVKTGAYIGAAGGAAYGLLCGPWFFLCSPYFAVIGAAGGVVAGAGVEVLTSNIDQKKLLFTKMGNYLQINNPQESFLTRLISIAEPRYSISSLSTKNISVLVDKLTFYTTSDGRIVLKIKAKVTVDYLDKSGEKQSATKDYHYRSAPQFIDTWLEANDEFYKIKLTAGYNNLAEHIIRTL
jgi:hypothetical protein